jgi:hypothetical protein
MFRLFQGALGGETCLSSKVAFRFVKLPPSHFVKTPLYHFRKPQPFLASSYPPRGGFKGDFGQEIKLLDKANFDRT